jgi:RHS repeat-associated protein
LLLQILVLFSVHALAANPPHHHSVHRKGPTPDSTEKISEKDVTVTAEAQPSTFVNHVNTIFGNLLIPTVDLSFEGPTPLSMVRYYNSQNVGYTWLFGIGMTSNYAQIIKGMPVSDRAAEIMDKKASKSNDKDAFVYAVADEDGGSLISCSAKPELKEMDFYLDPDTIHKGLTNTGTGEISARTNLKNTKMHTKGHWRYNNDVGRYLEVEWDMTTCDGTERNYFKTVNFEEGMYIHQERRPSGNKLMFDYTKNDIFGHILKEIKAENFSHQHTFGKLKIDCDNKHKKVEIESSNGKKVTYTYELHSHGKVRHCPLMSEITSSDHPTLRYYYTHGEKAPYLLSYVGYPDGRYLKIYYDDKDRVTEQKGPVGPDDKEVTLFRFKYYPHENKTEVFDANDYRSVYYYSSRKRLKTIERHNHKGKILREEKFFWGEHEHLARGERDDSDEGHLLAKAIKQDGKAIKCTRYTYDNYGNVTEERLYGNLTGQGTKKFSLNDEGKPEGDVESYKKYFSFYKDQFHMVKKESEENGPEISYEYKKDTNLVEAKFTKKEDHIRIREFFEYDSDAVLVKKIIDDGSSPHEKDLKNVTERHSTYVTPVRGKEGHGVGQPKEIEEFYLDLPSGKEVLLKKVEYEYDKAGRVTKETLFDAHKKEQYHTQYTYDDLGNLTNKRHSAGKEYLFSYDQNCNKIREELVGSGMHTEYVYDKANRLIKEISVHENGPAFTTQYSYDKASNKVAVTDPMGRVTNLSYDGLKRPRSISYPEMVDATGTKVTPSEHKSYDALNSPTSIIDCNGRTTTFEHTIRGKPCLITYPDGSTEKAQYHRNGTVAKKWDRHGTLTEYEYDFLNRPTKITVAGTKVTLHTYSSFHETSSTDPMGIVTTLSYDAAGRVIQEEKEGKKIRFEYDSLGRKHCTKSFENDASWIAAYIEYDFFDRVMEERSEHSDGTLLSLQKYEYNILDHKTKTLTYTASATFSTDRIEYNSLGLPAKHIDALGNATLFNYDYTWKNDLNQTVLRKETIDPMGNKTYEIFDAYDRVDTLERRSSSNTLLSKIVFRYDPKGNKRKETHSIYANGVFLHDYIIQWTYTSADLIETCTEQPGLPEEKKTSYTYFPGGLIDTITKPNGVSLHHTYDPFCRLSQMHASDESVNYTYEYDLNDNVLSVTDSKLQMTHKKTYDHHNRIVKDSMGTGIESNFSYDRLDRITTASFGTNISIAYRYLSGRLHEIARTDNSQDLYVHRYDAFDLVGHVTQSSLIQSCGTLQYHWDALQRLSSLASPHYEENCANFDAAGNLLEITSTDPQGEVTSTFKYDDLYQLIEEHGLFDISYKNDSLCNRLKKDDATYDVNSLNELLSSPDTTFTYDKNGNPIEMHTPSKTLLLSYDALDRLTAVEEPTLSRTEYGYDASHRRLFKKTFAWTNSSWQQTSFLRFLFFNRREVGSTSADNTIKEFRVLGLGKGAELGASIALELDGQLFCPLHDHRGNITVLLNTTTKQPTITYRYSAFGEEHTFGTSSNPWHFASKRLDPETNFIFFGQRYYSAPLGRFLTPDPLGFTDGPNLYAYVKNNPLTFYDLFGLNEEPCGGKGFWSTLHEGCVRGSIETYISDELKFINKYDERKSYANKNEPPTVLGSGVVALSVNNRELMGEFEDPSVGLLNGETLKEFCEKHKGENLGARIGAFWNGIGNTRVEAYEEAEGVKNAAGDRCENLLVCHNPSNGLFFDVVEAACQWLGYRTGADKVLGDKFVETCKMLSTYNVAATIEQIPHSQGGMTCHNSLSGYSFQKNGEYKNYIGKVVTFGSPSYYPEALNYRARGDWISGLGYLRPSERGKVITCGKWQNTFSAHAFAGPSYQDALKDAIENQGLFSD